MGMSIYDRYELQGKRLALAIAALKRLADAGLCDDCNEGHTYDPAECWCQKEHEAALKQARAAIAATEAR